jgi:aldose 1-epimerase
MFKITTTDFFGTEKIKLLNPQSGEYVSIIPAYGGNLNELVLSKDDKLHSIIAGDKTLESLSGKTENYYRGTKLSPFPNRINNGKYTFNDKEYQLEVNAPPHALHGLCWNLPFTTKEQSATNNSARLILYANYNALHKGYPFTYQIEIECVLEPGNFKCATRITNSGEQSIPIGDGWHPYFMTGSKVNNLKLQLPEKKQLELDNSLIPTGNYVPGNSFSVPTLLYNTQLDHCFELDTTNAITETRLIDQSKNISIIIWQQGYKFIQVYTPPDRNSIAIEPMSCAPDAFNSKNGLIALSPKESTEFSFGVRLE